MVAAVVVEDVVLVVVVVVVVRVVVTKEHGIGIKTIPALTVSQPYDHKHD